MTHILGISTSVLLMITSSMLLIFSLRELYQYFTSEKDKYFQGQGVLVKVFVNNAYIWAKGTYASYHTVKRTHLVKCGTRYIERSRKEVAEYYECLEED